MKTAVIRSVQPSQRPKPIREVVVALQTSSGTGRLVLEGIFRHLRQGHHWNLHLVQSPDEFTPDLVRTATRDGVDGLLVSLRGPQKTIMELARTTLPTVAIGMQYPPFATRQHNVTFILDDNRGIGETAAHHLLSLGDFRSFVYVPNIVQSPWSDERGTAYADLLASRGRACARYCCASAVTLEAYRRDLTRWLDSLPKPAAIFVSDDLSATHVLDACRQAGFRVPGHVAVLGTDNDELLCDYTSPTLSSIRFVDPGQGQLAARELDRLMDARKPTERRIVLWTFREVVERESAAPIVPAAHLVRRALAFIDRMVCSGIGVQDVVRELGVSHRLACLRFREIENRSLRDAILERRFAELKKRLLETNQPIRSVAAACGFGDLVNLARQFRKRHGVSMREFRKSAFLGTPESVLESGKRSRGTSRTSKPICKRNAKQKCLA